MKILFSNTIGILLCLATIGVNFIVGNKYFPWILVLCLVLYHSRKLSFSKFTVKIYELYIWLPICFAILLALYIVEIKLGIPREAHLLSKGVPFIPNYLIGIYSTEFILKFFKIKAQDINI